MINNHFSYLHLDLDIWPMYNLAVHIYFSCFFLWESTHCTKNITYIY